MLIRLRDEERGISLIIAILVTFVITLLSITVIDLAIHNVQQSGYDRKRVQSVSAAEAGVDYVWNQLQQTQPQNMPWNGTSKTGTYIGTLGTGPGTASFTATLTYFDSNQVQMTTQPSQTNFPTYVLITSSGTTNGSVTRKVQTYVKLTPIRQAIQSAVLINTSGTLSGNFTINGDQGNDGDIHFDNATSVTIGNQEQIYGSVYVSNGSLTVQNNSSIHGDAWSWLGSTIQNPATVLGNVKSSSSSLSGNGDVSGDATAGTTIASQLHVAGNKYASSPTTQHPPTGVFPLVCWTDSGSCVGQAGVWQTQDSWNNVTYAATPDGVADWTIVTFSDCSLAHAFLVNTHILTDTVVRITSVCDLPIALNDTIQFDRNLAIFTDGSITMANQNTWNGQNNNSLMLIVNYRSMFTPYPGSCSSAYNITTGNYSNFNNVYVSFYSPCTVTINNLNSFSGQIIGQNVVLANNFTMNYQPVLIPGIGTILGFKQDVVYEREIA